MSFLLLLVLLTAEDCSDSNVEITREDKLSAIFIDIEDEFENDDLAQKTIIALEKRAIQKLQDLADYTNVYADSSLSLSFRKQARTMIRGIFLTEIDVRDFYKELDLFEDSVNTIVRYSNLEDSSSYYTKFDSIIVSENLRKKANSNYYGELSFSQKVHRITTHDTTLVGSFHRTSQIRVLKTEKEFGNKIQDVWELYLLK